MTTADTSPAPLPAADDAVEPSHRGRWIAVDWLVALALVGGAIALRARPIAPHSLWIDDAWVSLLWKVHTVHDVRRISVASPGFVVGLKAWFAVAGFSALRAQMPAFVFGVLAAPVIYVAARSWQLRRPAALLAAGLVLTSPMHIRYSSRVKAFTLESLAAAVVLIVANRLLSHPDRRARWYAFGAAAVVATMLSAPLVIVVLPGFVAGFVAARREGKLPRAGIETTAAFGAFGLAWYVFAIHDAIDKNLVAYWRNYYISHDSVGDFFSSALHDLTRLARGFTPLPTAVTLIALAVCLAFATTRRPDRAVLLFGPLFVAAVLAILERNPLGGGRTDIYLYASLTIALAYGADALLTHLPSPAGTTVAVVVVALLSIITLPVPTYPKENLRPMLAVVKKNAGPSDVIVLYPKARFAAALYSNWPFHLSTPAPGISVTTPFDVVIDKANVLVPPDVSPVQFDATVKAAADRTRRIWYIGSHADESGWKRGDAALRAAGYVLRFRRGFPPHYWVGLWIGPPTATP